MSSHETTPIETDFRVDKRFSIITSPEVLEQATERVERVLSLGEIAEDFKDVTRKPRVASGRKENDAEHSWHLGVVAADLAAKYYPDLDIERIRAFSGVHDLPEVGYGDISTFGLTDAQMAEKKRLDEEGKEQMLVRLGDGIARDDLEEYERQDTAEARFVRAVDKLLPIVVTLTSGNLQPLRDYGVDSLEKLKEFYDVIHARIKKDFEDEYPELVATHAVLCRLLEEEFVRVSGEPDANETQRSSIEFEYKYLVDLSEVPDWVFTGSNLRREELRQGYSGIGDDGSEARVRSYDDERFDITVKQPGTIEREEEVIQISKDLFEDMWSKCEGQRLEKIRYTIPYGQWRIELDIYPDGSAVAEVEFNKDNRIADARLHASTFEAPEWFGENVSEDNRYKTQNVARFGLPNRGIVGASS